MKKWLWCAVAVLLCAGILLHGVSGPAAVEAAATGGKDKPIYCVDTQEKRIAVTFDAAWGADDTDELLRILDEYDAKATFFLVGFWAEKYADEVKKISEHGHEIGNHSANHPKMSTLSKEQILAELRSANEVICRVTGKTPTMFRPPYGDYDDLLVGTVREEQMHTIQWSVDSLDWKKNATADSICKRVLSRTTCGSILLFHNDADCTPAALPTILKSLKEQGYTFCTVSELIYPNPYVVDQQGVQHCGT